MKAPPCGVCLPTVWPRKRPKSVHKTTEVSTTTLRQRGIRLIACLDEFFIMADLKQTPLQHAAKTLNILEGLGYLTIPSQKIAFLGYTVNSVSMSLTLPKDKLRKVQHYCKKTFGQSIHQFESCQKSLANILVH